MARRYGTAGSISSLISSARSAYEKEQAYQDQIAAYEWDLSAKTAEDHDKYVAYLSKRQKDLEVRDPAKALSIASKINSARSTFTSREIQRQSIAINYGQGTDSDKYNKMFSLYQNAVQNGDLDLAQSLESQMATLQIKIQNAAAAAASAAGAAATKAQAAEKKGIDERLQLISRLDSANETDWKTGKISRQEYLSKKQQITDARANTLRDTVQIGEDGLVRSSKNLSQDAVEGYAKQLFDFERSTDAAQFLGRGGDLIKRGLSPFNETTDQFGQTKIVDRPYNDFSWMGGNELTPGTIAAPNFVDKVDKGALKKDLEQLGFKNLKDGNKVVLANGQEVQVIVKNINGKKAAYYIAKDGTPKQITPDGKTALLMSSERMGGTDYYSPLMEQQNKIAQAEADKRLGALPKAVKAIGSLGNRTPVVGSYAESVRKATSGRAGFGDAMNILSGGFTGVVGSGLSKLAQISGLTKRLNDQKAQQAAQRAAELQQQQQALAQARQQQAAADKAVKVPTFDPRRGIVVGGVGPVAPTPQQKKAANTPGTPEFNRKYLGIRL